MLYCRHIITCGNDGDVRIYNGFDDSDPVSYRIGDAVFCVCFKVSSVVVFHKYTCVIAPPICFRPWRYTNLFTYLLTHAQEACTRNLH